MRHRAALIFLFAAACAHQRVVTVDASLRELRARGAGAFAFRGDDGLLGDAGGQLFATHDAGETWTQLDLGPRASADVLHAVDAIAWTGETSAIAHVAGDDHVLRTTDGGHTFTTVSLSSRGERLRSAIVNGHDVWLCGHDLFRSRDGGATFVAVVAPNETDACRGIAFTDGTHGWLAAERTISVTEDGGETWTARGPVPDDPRDLVAASADVAWVRGAEGTFRTSDGGRSFTRVPVRAQAEPRVAEVLGHRMIVLGQDVAIETLAPAFPREVAVVDADRFAITTATRVVVHGPKGEVALDRLASRSGPPAVEQLRAEADVVEPLETVHQGLSEKHAYVEAKGRGWLVVGDLPASTRRAAFAAGYGLVAEASDGLYRSADGGRTWSRTSEQSWTRFELERASGRRPVSPLACAVDAGRGTLTVHVAYRGCLGDQQRELALAWDGDSATVQGQSVPLPQLRALAFRLVTAASHPEAPEQGVSTAAVTTQLRWSCGGPTQSVAFGAIYLDPKDATPNRHLRRAQRLDAIAAGVLGPAK